MMDEGKGFPHGLLCAGSRFGGCLHLPPLRPAFWHWTNLVAVRVPVLVSLSLAPCV